MNTNRHPRYARALVAVAAIAAAAGVFGAGLAASGSDDEIPRPASPLTRAASAASSSGCDEPPPGSEGVNVAVWRQACLTLAQLEGVKTSAAELGGQVERTIDRRTRR